ncbi:hypothetical protein BD309DRAFT_731077 [Dichomitus squalens]|nr:hypothetical protein BD309DRAFT_731077 [Dichomitus squalens]
MHASWQTLRTRSSHVHDSIPGAAFRLTLRLGNVNVAVTLAYTKAGHRNLLVSVMNHGRPRSHRLAELSNFAGFMDLSGREVPRLFLYFDATGYVHEPVPVGKRSHDFLMPPRHVPMETLSVHRR